MKQYLLLFVITFTFINIVLSQEKLVGGIKLYHKNFVDSMSNFQFDVKSHSNQTFEKKTHIIITEKGKQIKHIELPIGTYDLTISSEKFIDIVISDVEVFSEKLTFVDFDLVLKESPTDSRKITSKYAKPKVASCN